MAQAARSGTAAYLVLFRALRSAVLSGAYGEHRRLPTEAELTAASGLSRQTVRRAMQELVNDGLVYRVPGRGTYPTQANGRYLRHFGSVDDLMALSVDTLFELVLPLQRRIDIEAAGRLRLETDDVVSLAFLRLHDDVPFSHTTVYLPPKVAALLDDVTDLTTPGTTGRATVLGLLEERLPERIGDAEQSITAVAAPPAVAASLRCADGEPVLRVDRVYFDDREQPVELAISYFLPSQYSYRSRLRRSAR